MNSTNTYRFGFAGLSTVPDNNTLNLNSWNHILVTVDSKGYTEIWTNGVLSLYNNFISDLSYILFNNQEQIEFFTSSDIQKDTRVIINYKLNSRDTEKDIALLGSGTLQIIEILLNLYYYHFQIVLKFRVFLCYMFLKINMYEIYYLELYIMIYYHHPNKYMH